MSHPIPIETGLLDFDAATLEKPSSIVALTPIESALLAHLFEVGEPVPAKDLLAAVWGYREGVKSRTVTVTVERIRKKIEADPKNPVTLVTVKGHGYALRTLAAPTEVPGRDNEWALLDHDEAALVTLVGPGGIGKTTLARAWSRRHRLPFVPLELASTVEDLAVAICDAMNAPGPVVDPVAEAARITVGRTVVLDNFEQLPPEAARQVKAWIAHGARFVVTSQRPLGLDAESVIPVGPLSQETARELLLIGRASAGLPAPDAELLDRWLPRLGGVPLVLEISAPLLDWLDRVDDVLDLPSERADAPDRHASVAQALTWTTDQLPEAARTFVDALAFAAGTLTLDEVSRLTGRPRPACLAALRETQRRGLLADPDPGALDVLPVVRAHLRRSHAEPERLLRAHAEMVASWPLSVPDLRPRMPEIRLAARRASGPPLLAVLERLMEVLQATGPATEAPGRVERARERLPEADRGRGDALLAEALVLAHRPAEALELSPDLPADDHGWLVRWVGVRAHALRWQGDREGAAAAGQRCLAHGEASGDDLILARARGYCGMALQDTDPARAAELLTHAIDGLVRHGQQREALVAELARANALSRIDPTVDVAQRVQARRRAAAADGVGQLSLGLASAICSLIFFDAGDVSKGEAAAAEAFEALGHDQVHVAEFSLHLALRQLHDRELALATLDNVPPDPPGVGLQLRRMVQALAERDPLVLKLVEDDDLRTLGEAFLAGEELPVVERALRTRLGLLAVQARVP